MSWPHVNHANQLPDGVCTKKKRKVDGALLWMSCCLKFKGNPRTWKFRTVRNMHCLVQEEPLVSFKSNIITFLWKTFGYKERRAGLIQPRFDNSSTQEMNGLKTQFHPFIYAGSTCGCLIFNHFYISLDLTHLTYIIKMQNTRRLSVCSRSWGQAGSWGGQNHREKGGFKGIRPHLLRDDWKHLGTLSNTRSWDIHTPILHSSPSFHQILGHDADPRGVVWNL